MKKTTATIIAFCLILVAFGQVAEHQKIIELGKIYKDFMFRNEPPKSLLKEVKKDVPENLKAAADFILQTITTKNQLLAKSYLSRPDDEVLKQIYIIRKINLNMREENSVENSKMIDSLSSIKIPSYELLDNYYGMLFTTVGNKNQPFNLSKTDLKLKDYNLKDDTEKGILVLKAISFCGTTIWGYMNIPKPPNTKTALSYLKNFPKINGSPYFQYTDFYFADFEMNIVKDQGSESYKHYYLDKYYEILLSHLICLKKESSSEKEQNDLLLGSILKERKLYKYSKYKETLEDIFKEQVE